MTTLVTVVGIGLLLVIGFGGFAFALVDSDETPRTLSSRGLMFLLGALCFGGAIFLLLTTGSDQWRCGLYDGRMVIVDEEPSGAWIVSEGERIPAANVRGCQQL